MKKAIATAAVMLALSAQGWAQGPRPVMEIFFDGLERHEAALVANAAARCAGLFYVQSALMLRDTNDKEAAEAFQESASSLQISMVITNGMIRKNRGVEVDNDALMEDAQQQTSANVGFYSDRMKVNQLNTGEMFGQDELIKLDLKLCPLLPDLLDSEAWAKTLMTNDWSFWDDNFK